MNYADFESLIVQTVGSTSDSSYPKLLLWQATCLALVAIMPFAPKRQIATITADGEKDKFDLPEDIYSIEGIQDVSTGTFMNPISITTGLIRNLEGVNSKGFDWMEYPNKKVYLSKVLDGGVEFRLYYTAYYKKPDSQTATQFVFETPDYLTPGLLYYACSHCMNPSASRSAQVRQWNQKLDSGAPTDNVLTDMALYYRKLFIDEMARVPRYSGPKK